MEERLRILVCKPRLAVQTIRLNRFIRCEPLELEYLYTVLQKHDVSLLDGIVDRRDPVRMASKLKSQVVLFTSLITTLSDVIKTARRLKRLPDPPLIFVGGPHAEVVPQDFYDDSIDGVIFANQLEAIVRVIDRIRKKEAFHDIAGGAFRVNGQFHRIHSPPLDPLSLPRARHILLEQFPKRYKIVYYHPCASIKTSFGCSGKCNFCFCTEMHGGSYGARPMDEVIREIEEIPVRNILILDDNFLSTRKRLLEFSELIAERKIQKEFIAIGNAKFIAENPDVMSKLKEAGVAAVMVGFEFVTDEELVSVNKDASLIHNKLTIEICKELDIDLFALFIINPDWNHSDFRRLARYLRNNYIPFALYSTLTVFPGTQMARSMPDVPRDLSRGWRYDLLRLHKKPLHMSPFRFYMWLFYLYMIPGMRFTTIKKHQQRYGLGGIIRHTITSLFMGLEYFFKLLIWK